MPTIGRFWLTNYLMTISRFLVSKLEDGCSRMASIPNEIRKYGTYQLGDGDEKDIDWASDVGTEGVTKVGYEEALKMTGFSFHNICTFIMCNSVTVAIVTEIGGLCFLIPTSSQELTMYPELQGMISFLPIIGIVITAITWGSLADYRGRKRLVRRHITMGFVMGLWATFAPESVSFYTLKSLSATFVGFGYIIAQTLLSECTPKPWKSGLVILSTSIAMVTFGLSYAIARIVLLESSYYIPMLNIQLTAWRLLNLIMAVPSGISIIFVTMLYDSPKFLLSVEEKAEALEILRAMFVRNTGLSGENYKVQVDTLFLNERGLTGKPSMRLAILERSLLLVRSPLLKYSNLLFWMYSINFTSIIFLCSWLHVISEDFVSVRTDEPGLSLCGIINSPLNCTTGTVSILDKSFVHASTVTIMCTAFIILAVLNVATSVLVNFVDKKKIYIAIQFLAGLAMLFVNDTDSRIVIPVLIQIYLISVLNCGIINSYIFEIFPTFIRSSAACVIMAKALAVGYFLTLAWQQLHYSYCELVFYISGVLTCIGGLLGFYLPSDTNISKQENNKQEKAEDEEKVQLETEEKDSKQKTLEV